MVYAPPADDERRALLDEVERFARGVIAPRVARPEAPMDPATFGAVLGEAEALGLPGSISEPTGLAPWEGVLEGGPVGGTPELLRRLGRSNVAVGYVVHQRALARSLIRAAGLPPAPAPAIAPEGGYGLGRTGLARMLAGAELDPADRAILEDIYGPRASRVLSLDPAFDALIVPVRATHGQLEWALHRRGGLLLEDGSPAHGLDELWTGRVTPVADPDGLSDLGPSRAATMTAAAIAAHQLALLALSAGALERALDLAVPFAAERWQGGTRIERHAAVMTLLGQARATARSVRSQLGTLAGRHLDVEGLKDVLALRAASQPALADAANAALQVLGGVGYMRDTGLEKIVRDVNHLRCFAGGPTDLAIVLSELERAHA